jgi:hypothetical protein
MLMEPWSDFLTRDRCSLVSRCVFERREDDVRNTSSEEVDGGKRVEGRYRVEMEGTGL